MSGLWAHAVASLRLHFRNKLALVYGYAFPLLFMAAFWVIYRHEQVPLWRHCGEILTIGILGGACFGLPTTLVSERERGLWRRYRLTPAPVWTLVAGSAFVRYLILLSAGLLQLVVARATGVPWPADPMGLLFAFTCAAFAFIGLGLVIAMLADNVPAVQALGQCVFLPMLVIGGVAVPLSTLPGWAQQLSAFFPGRYAVEAIQAAVTEAGQPASMFAEVVLILNGIAGVLAAIFLFRWETGAITTGFRRGWAWLVLAAWLVIGFLAQDLKNETAPVQPAPETARLETAWTRTRAEDVTRLDFALPADTSVVTPIATEEDVPDSYLAEELEIVRARLPGWAPAHVTDPLQAVRNLLSVAAVADVLQRPVERHVPHIVLRQLSETYPKAQLIRMLTWIALHPEEGTVIASAGELGIPGVVDDERELRQRVRVYATKFIARLTGRTYVSVP
jgi:hypothetical protein